MSKIVIDIGKSASYSGWWLHVNGHSMGLYTWHWTARRAAKKIARAQGAQKTIARDPYPYGFSLFVPYESWERQ